MNGKMNRFLRTIWSCHILMHICSADTNAPPEILQIGTPKDLYAEVQKALTYFGLEGEANVTLLARGCSDGQLSSNLPKQKCIIPDDIHAVITEFPPQQFDEGNSAAAVATKQGILTFSQWHNVDASGRKKAEPAETNFVISPTPAVLGQAIADVMLAYGWKRAAVFYEPSAVQHAALTIDSMMKKWGFVLQVWAISAEMSDTDIIYRFMSINQAHIRQVIILIHDEHAQLTMRIFDAARRLTALSYPPYAWISLGVPKRFIKEYIGYVNHANVNHTAISLVASDDFPLQGSWSNDFTLLGDTLLMLQTTWSKVKNTLSNNKTNLTVQDLRRLLVTHTKQISYKGFTGPIEFGASNQRRAYELGLWFLLEDDTSSKGGVLFDIFAHKIGLWGTQHGLSLSWPNDIGIFRHEGRAFLGNDLSVRVVTLIEPPFVMLKKNHESFDQNSKFEGFLIDYLHHLASILKFKYQIYLVPDGLYGTLSAVTNTWNGLMAEVVAGNATMALAPLAVYKEREEAVDFAPSIVTREVSAVIRVKHRSLNSYFEFLRPFTSQTWLCILLIAAVLSVVMAILEKFGAPMRRDLPPMGILESYWFVFGTLLEGSTENTPQSISSRLVTFMWFFFAMIVVNTYTAKLTSFMTIKSYRTPLRSLADLADQDEYMYGTVYGTAIDHYFRHVATGPYREMHQQMRLHPQWMVNSTEEGLKRVQQEKYAFIFETQSIDFWMSRDCHLRRLSDSIDPKDLSIAVPSRARYLRSLRQAVLQIEEKGITQQLSKRWWPEDKCAKSRDAAEGMSSSDDEPLKLSSILGVFVFLLGALLLSSLWSSVEQGLKRRFAWKKLRFKSSKPGPRLIENPEKLTEFPTSDKLTLLSRVLAKNKTDQAANNGPASPVLSNQVDTNQTVTPPSSSDPFNTSITAFISDSRYPSSAV